MAIRVNCPYCQNENPVPDERRGGLSFITCDIDDSAGCDKTFVIDITIRKTVVAKKIEGQEVSNG